MKKQLIAMVGGLLILVGSGQVLAVQYTIKNLGTLGGNSSYANGINNKGQVVGYSTTIAGSYNGHAFLYDGSVMRDLGTLGGSRSTAWDINDSGQVVGQSYIAGNVYEHGFYYDGTAMRDVGTLADNQSWVNGINNSGMAVGETSGGPRAFSYDGAVMQELGKFVPWDINDNGLIAAEMSSANSYHHAFLYNGGAMQDLGTLGGNSSVPWEINNSGQIVGWAHNVNNYYRAFLYDGTSMRDLGTLGGTYSWAVGINNSGQVVGGSYYNMTTYDTHAFLYANGRMIDLNTLLPFNSGWVLSYATGINDLGQIVGYGRFNGSSELAFLMSPIPEPASLLMLGIGGIVIRLNIKRISLTRNRKSSSEFSGK